MRIKNVTIGADPEVFLELNGRIVSAEGIIGGTKDEPLKINDNGFFMQEDNIMVEFNVPPASTKEDFVNNMKYVIEYIETFVKLKGKYNLNFSQSATIDRKYLNTDQAKQFGCDPDFNVYDKCVNDPPSSRGDLRCCGGHIHVGYDNPTQETSECIIQALDIMIGLDSVILDPDINRKKLYGKAGTFRFKPYGVEYRTPSNFWIVNDDTVGWVFDRVHQAVELVNSNKIYHIVNKYQDSIRYIINNHDVDGAISLTLELNKIQEKVTK